MIYDGMDGSMMTFIGVHCLQQDEYGFQTTKHQATVKTKYKPWYLLRKFGTVYYVPMPTINHSQLALQKC